MSEQHDLSDDQCDRLVTLTIAKLAAKHGNEPSDISTDIVGHRSLGRSLIHVAYMLGKTAALAAPAAKLEEMSPEFTDTARAALLWVLWHHQGGSSKVGQPIRFALGMGAHEHLSEHQVQEAKRWAGLQKEAPHPTPPASWDEYAMREAARLWALPAMPQPQLTAVLHVALVDAMRFAAHPDTARLEWLLPNLHPATWGMEFEGGYEWADVAEYLAKWRAAIDAEMGGAPAPDFQGVSVQHRAPLTERQVVGVLSEAGCIGTVKMSYESGPYDIDRPSINATRLVRAVEAAHRINAAPPTTQHALIDAGGSAPGMLDVPRRTGDANG